MGQYLRMGLSITDVKNKKKILKNVHECVWVSICVWVSKVHVNSVWEIKTRFELHKR